MTEGIDPGACGFGGTLRRGDRPALILIDLMEAYFEAGSPFCVASDDCVAAAARLLESARASGVPVVHTRVEFAPGCVDGGLFVQKVPALRVLERGSPLGRLRSEVSPLEDEIVIVKQYASAFFGTSLASTLRAAGVDSVILAGVSTSGCVRATAVDALQHGFIPLVVRDAVGDRDEESHTVSLRDLQAKYAEVVSAERMLSHLASKG